MVTPHQHASDDRGHGHVHGEAGQADAGHGHDHGHANRQDDWNDEDFVEDWLARQKERGPERRRQFVVLRAFIPKNPNQEFRYLNLGAGPGNLDKVLLEHFPGANAVVLDGSLAMLTAAQRELAQFGERVEYVQADLSSPDWTGAVAGPFDFIVSIQALHHLDDPRRIRALYREVYQLTGHGGTLLNMDYVRPPKRELVPLQEWIARDPEAGFSPRSAHGGNVPGSTIEHLSWLSEAGFNSVDVFWKEMNIALFGATRDHLHMPEGHGGGHDSGHGHGGGHGHA